MMKPIHARRPVPLLSLLLLVLAALSPGLTFGQSADWPQWRGPERTGRSSETGLLRQWPEEGPALAWKATGLGAGYAGVSVTEGRVFTMGDVDQASSVVALNEADGSLLWTARVGRPGAPGWGGFAGPRCTPTVDGNLVFGVGQYGEVVCLDAASGKELWRKDYEADFGGKRPEWGYCGMPLVDGDRVILAPGGPKGNLVALEKQTGRFLWQSSEFTDGIHYSSPIVAQIGGVRQYVQLTDASVAGIAADDGRMLWTAPRRGRTAVIPTPILRDNRVYVSSGYGAGSNLFEVTSEDGEFTAEEVYANKVMTNHHGGVILIGEHLYGYSDSKGWTCQDFATGEAAWQEKDPLGKGSAVFADGMLYLREEGGAGTVALVEPSPEGYREVSRFDQPERSDKNSWPHPVVAGGRLYLRDQDLLLCYKVRSE